MQRTEWVNPYRGGEEIENKGIERHLLYSPILSRATLASAFLFATYNVYCFISFHHQLGDHDNHNNNNDDALASSSEGIRSVVDRHGLKSVLGHWLVEEGRWLIKEGQRLQDPGDGNSLAHRENDKADTVGDEFEAEFLVEPRTTRTRTLTTLTRRVRRSLRRSLTINGTLIWRKWRVESLVRDRSG